MAVRYKREKATSRGTPQSEDRLPGVPWLPFLMAYHPQNWEFIAGEWLPKVDQVPTRPGVNGCKGAFNNDGTLKWVNATLMRASMEARGWRFLPEDTEVVRTDRDTGDLVTEQGYLDSIEGIRGTFYCSPWDEPARVGYGRGATASLGEWDIDGYNAWRRMLVQRGLVGQPPTEVLAEKVKIQETRANRKLQQAHDGAPHIQAKVEAEHERLDAMRTAAGLDAKNKPKKKVARSRRKKAAVPEVTDGV